jgi:hypothetical protein
LPRAFGFTNFRELDFQCIGLPNFLNSGIKSGLPVQSRCHLPLNFFAQMNFQFFQRHGRFDSGGEHLFSPFDD